ncbi:transposase [bacterium]|nr:transposase [bacterium]
MPKRKVPLINDHFYHVYNRVEKGRKLFYNDEHYLFFLKLWLDVDFKSSCKILAYCLMPTHFHYLLQVLDSDLFSKKMSYFFNRYCKSLNTQTNQTGNIFPNRFKAKIITDEKYLTGLCGYIHMNPVRTEMVSAPEQWPYSNYLSCIGRGEDKICD